MSTESLPYVAPPRCPDELLASDLKDWVVRVWLTIRKVQGSNPYAWAQASYYAASCGKSVSQVRNAISILTASGWLEVVERVHNTPYLRCTVPGGSGVEASLVVTPAPVEASLVVTDDPSSVTGGDASPLQASLVVTPAVTGGDAAVTGGDACIYKEESYQGILSLNPLPKEKKEKVGDESREDPASDGPPLTGIAAQVHAAIEAGRLERERALDAARERRRPLRRVPLAVPADRDALPTA